MNSTLTLQLSVLFLSLISCFALCCQFQSQSLIPVVYTELRTRVFHFSVALRLCDTFFYVTKLSLKAALGETGLK